MSSVEAVPIFMIVSSAPRCPSRRTMLVCGEIPVANMRHIVNIDGGVPDRLDRKIIELLHRAGAGVETDVVFELPDLRSSRRQNQVLLR